MTTDEKPFRVADGVFMAVRRAQTERAKTAGDPLANPVKVHDDKPMVATICCQLSLENETCPTCRLQLTLC